MSLNRYGFRVGVRPAFSSKIEYDKETMKEVETIYGTIDNFENYVMLLKLLTAVGSICAENLLN